MVVAGVLAVYGVVLAAALQGVGAASAPPFLILLGLVAAAVAGLKGYNCNLRVSESEVLVANLFGRHQVARSDVVSIEWCPRWWRVASVYLVSSNGSRVSVLGLPAERVLELSTALDAEVIRR